VRDAQDIPLLNSYKDQVRDRLIHVQCERCGNSFDEELLLCGVRKIFLYRSLFVID